MGIVTLLPDLITVGSKQWLMHSQLLKDYPMSDYLGIIAVFAAIGLVFPVINAICDEWIKTGKALDSMQYNPENNLKEKK